MSALLNDGVDLLDRLGAGHFACGASAHSVGNDVQVEFAIHQIRIFVVIAHATDVRFAVNIDLHHSSCLALPAPDPQPVMHLFVPPTKKMRLRRLLR